MPPGRRSAGETGPRMRPEPDAGTVAAGRWAVLREQPETRRKANMIINRTTNVTSDEENAQSINKEPREMQLLSGAGV